MQWTFCSLAIGTSLISLSFSPTIHFTTEKVNKPRLLTGGCYITSPSISSLLVLSPFAHVYCLFKTFGQPLFFIDHLLFPCLAISFFGKLPIMTITLLFQTGPLRFIHWRFETLGHLEHVQDCGVVELPLGFWVLVARFEAARQPARIANESNMIAQGNSACTHPCSSRWSSKVEKKLKF